MVMNEYHQTHCCAHQLGCYIPLINSGQQASDASIHVYLLSWWKLHTLPQDLPPLQSDVNSHALQ